MIRCTCLDNLPVIPKWGEPAIRPKATCQLHKILAEHWDDIHTQEEYDSAMIADEIRLLHEKRMTDAEQRAR
jgi:hypothetical protein